MRREQMRKRNQNQKQKACRRAVLLAVLTAMALTGSVTAKAAEEKSSIEQQDEKLDYYVFPDSDSRYLDYADIWRLSREDLRIAKNEIYARHGRRFNSPELQTYFDSMAWYEGTIAPEQFDQSCFNAFESANVAFLDWEWQNGTGAENSSVIRNEIAAQKEVMSFETARMEDLIGLDAFGEEVTVLYKKQEPTVTEKQEPDYAVLGSFYRKDGEFFGNIGFRRNISYRSEGEPCAWYQGHLYEEHVEHCGDIQVSMPGLSSLHRDLYGLYEDGERIAWYEQSDDHASDGRGRVVWLVTEDAVYAGGSDGVKIFDRSGNLIGENAGLRYAFAVYDDTVYLMNENGVLVMAEHLTLEDDHIIDLTDCWVDPRCADENHFVYTYEENFYCFDMDGGTIRIIDEAQGWDSYALSGEYVYGVDWNADRNRTVIHRLSLKNGSKETVCAIEGVMYAALQEADENLLYLNVGPKEADWESAEGYMNSVQIAVDLEEGTVYILEAGWHS